MKKQITVTVEYVGGYTKMDAHEYRVLKINGAPTVEVEVEGNRNKYKTTRVGEIITEAQADELAARAGVAMTTLRKTE